LRRAWLGASHGRRNCHRGYAVGRALSHCDELLLPWICDLYHTEIYVGGRFICSVFTHGSHVSRSFRLCTTIARATRSGKESLHGDRGAAWCYCQSAFGPNLAERSLSSARCGALTLIGDFIWVLQVSGRLVAFPFLIFMATLFRARERFRTTFGNS